MVEVLDGRSRRRVERYLRSPPVERRRAIEVASIDPDEAHRQAIRNQLPWARTVVDHFHLVRGANTALDSVRRERQREHARRRPRGASLRQRRQPAPGPLPRPPPTAQGDERLTERERRRLIALFQREPLIAEAWGLKEHSRRSTAPPIAPRPSAASTTSSARSSAPSCPPLPPSPTACGSGAPSCWPTSTSQTTNGYAEGVINKVKAIKRRAYGLPRFDGFRERVLLACA